MHCHEKRRLGTTCVKDTKDILDNFAAKITKQQVVLVGTPDWFIGIGCLLRQNFTVILELKYEVQTTSQNIS